MKRRMNGATVRLTSPSFWLAVGMDMGLSRRADRPLTLWQESFVPMVLSRALRDVALPDTNGDTVLLVREEEVVLPGKLPPAPDQPADLRLLFLACGTALGALLPWLAHKRSRVCRASFRLLAITWWLTCGFSGLLLAGLWGLTAHWAARDNENLLLLDPLCLILPMLWWRAPRMAGFLAALIAAASLFSLVLRELPGFYQANLAFIALAVPVHVVLAALGWRQRSNRGVAAHGHIPLA